MRRRVLLAWIGLLLVGGLVAAELALRYSDLDLRSGSPYARDAAAALRDAHGITAGDPASAETLVLVLGDEIALGWGVMPSQRFGDVLAARCADCAVLNLAIGSSSTQAQVNALSAYLRSGGRPPDWIVWAYHLDDIAGSAGRRGLFWTPPVADVPAGLSGSALLTRLWLDAQSTARWAGYADWLYTQQNSPPVWITQQAALDSMVAALTSSGARWAVLLFPALSDPDPVRTIGPVDQVAQALPAEADVLRLYDLIAARGVAASIIDPARAPYPTPDLHAALADWLLSRLQADGDKR